MSELLTCSSIAFQWCDTLERQFDTAFVNCDTPLAQLQVMYDSDTQLDPSLLGQSRDQLMVLSSLFAQMTHKLHTMAVYNNDLMKENADLRQSLSFPISGDDPKVALNSHPPNHFKSLNHKKQINDKRILKVKHKMTQLKRENFTLRKEIFNLQSELCGARLASKYLEKELSGRIQQIQLLAAMRDNTLTNCITDNDRMWTQIEAEIHLNRHKVVSRACRAKCLGQHLPSPINDTFKHGIGQLRTVIVDKGPNDGLGISITGGKDHGVPILISQIHPNGSAALVNDIYVGDAILSVNGISLKDLKHSEASEILMRQEGKCIMEVVFVSDSPDDCHDQFDSIINTNRLISNMQYPFFDDQIMEMASLTLNENIDYDNDNEDSGDDDDADADDNCNANDSLSLKKYPGIAVLSTNTES